MDPTTSSTISRYRPAVIAFTCLAAAGSIVLLFGLHDSDSASPFDVLRILGNTSSLHRSNAVRRVSRRTQSAEFSSEEQLRDTDDDDIAFTELNEVSQPVMGLILHNLDIIEDHNPSLSGQGNEESTVNGNQLGMRHLGTFAQLDGDVDTEVEVMDDTVETDDSRRLKALAFTIAKNEHDKAGIVHHGVTCDNCDTCPIIGVRFHCSNCPDFDLCEDCESLECHLRTHVFYKVRIPAPWGGKDPLPPWYPGNPLKLPASLHEYPVFKKELSDKSKFAISKIEGLYAQFTCMANAKIETPVHLAFPFGIDRAAFNQCFTQQVMSNQKSTPSLVNERLFALFDSDKDGIIDFHDFVMGTSLVHKKDPLKRRLRVFHGLDLDEDGYISRKDCHTMMKPVYNMNQEILRGYLRIDRIAENATLVGGGSDPARHVNSGRALASFFNEPDQGPLFTDRYEESRGGKVRDQNGDMVLADPSIGTICTDHSKDDFCSQIDVALGSLKDARQILRTDCHRLAIGLEPIYLVDREDFCMVNGHPKTGPTPYIFRDEDERWYVACETEPDKSIAVTVYLRTFEAMMKPYDSRWYTKTRDEALAKQILASAEARMYLDVLPKKIKTKGLGRVRRLREQGEFYLNEDDSIHDDLRNLKTSLWPERYNEHPLRTGNFVGGSAATHTLYNAVTDTLNDMLDPLFLVSEALATEVRNTTLEREERDHELRTHFHATVGRVWRSSNVWVTAHVLQEGWNFKPGFSPQRQIDEIKDHIRRGGDPHMNSDKELFYFAYLVVMHNHGNFSKEEMALKLEAPSDIEKVGFIEWGFLIAAEVHVEERIKRLDPNYKASPITTPVLLSNMAWDQYQLSRLADEFALENDVTMPQHRPDAAAAATGTSISWEEQEKSRLNYLAYFAAAARVIDERGGNGLLDYGEFERAMTRDDPHDILCRWLESWLDLVMF